MELDRKAEFLADAAAVRLDVGERLAAVNLRLALAEQVEIGTVQDNDDRVHRASRNVARCHRVRLKHGRAAGSCGASAAVAIQGPSRFARPFPRRSTAREQRATTVAASPTSDAKRRAMRSMVAGAALSSGR